MESNSRRNGPGWDVVRIILPEWPAGLPRDIIQVQAGLCISIILVDARKQAMPLTTHVPELQHGVFRQFTLNGQVILLGVLGPKGRREIAKQHDRPEAREIDRRPWAGSLKPIKRIGCDHSALGQEWGIE